MSLFNGIKWPYATMQQLNLDWILMEIKRILGFFPEEGNTGTVLMKTDDGAAWEELPAIDININGVPEDTELTDTDKLIFYDVSSSANHKITAPNLLNSMMSNGTPLMDGTGSAGTSKKPARYDHRHPTDTSRQAALSGAQMNAVNSGAPANSFGSNGALLIANGGTSATRAGKAAENLRVLSFNEVPTHIAANSDLNAYAIPGAYVVESNSVAGSVSHMPAPNAGILRVFSANGADIHENDHYKYEIQEYITLGGEIYIRSGSSGDSTAVTWSAWKHISAT